MFTACNHPRQLTITSLPAVHRQQVLGYIRGHSVGYGESRDGMCEACGSYTIVRKNIYMVCRDCIHAMPRVTVNARAPTECVNLLITRAKYALGVLSVMNYHRNSMVSTRCCDICIRASGIDIELIDDGWLITTVTVCRQCIIAAEIHATHIRMMWLAVRCLVDELGDATQILRGVTLAVIACGYPHG